MIIFETADQYILSCTTLEERLEKISAVISAMFDMMIVAAATGNFEEYWMDTGQTKIKTRYRDTASIAKAIENFQLIEQRMVAQLNNQKLGRTVILVDKSNFIG